jgi:hypothetical protein
LWLLLRLSQLFLILDPEDGSDMFLRTSLRTQNTALFVFSVARALNSKCNHSLKWKRGPGAVDRCPTLQGRVTIATRVTHTRYRQPHVKPSNGMLIQNRRAERSPNVYTVTTRTAMFKSLKPQWILCVLR